MPPELPVEQQPQHIPDIFGYEEVSLSSTSIELESKRRLQKAWFRSIVDGSAVKHAAHKLLVLLSKRPVGRWNSTVEVPPLPNEWEEIGTRQALAVTLIWHRSDLIMSYVL